MIDFKKIKHRKILITSAIVIFLYAVCSTGFVQRHLIDIISVEKITDNAVLRAVMITIAPERLAVEISKSNQHPLICTTHSRSSRLPGLAFITAPWLDNKLSYMFWDGDYIPTFAASRFNRTIIMLPDFPLPHIVFPAEKVKSTFTGEINIEDALSHGGLTVEYYDQKLLIDTSSISVGSEYLVNKEFLNDLNISEKEYKARRFAVENSSIYAASFFGHLSGIKAHLKDVKECDGMYNYPIRYAKLGKNEEAIHLLVKHGADPKEYTCGPYVIMTY